MYSIRKVAQKMGISERHVRLLLEKGETKGKQLSRDRVVLSLDYRRKRRQKGGIVI